MRIVALFGMLLLWAAAPAFANPAPSAVTFTVAADDTEPAPLTNALRVEFYGGKLDGTVDAWQLQGGRLLQQPAAAWVGYRLPVQRYQDAYAIVTSGPDTMRLDLPADPTALLARATRRWARESPEVIRFRAGRYAFSDLVATPWADRAADQLSTALKRAEEKRYREIVKEEEARTRRPPPPQERTTIAPPSKQLTQTEFDAMQAKRPGLRTVAVERSRYKVKDTVWVRLSGRVLLDGGCGNAWPMFGVEQRIGQDWVQRLAVPRIQKDCGRPYGDWNDHRVGLPLSWWVSVNLPAGENVLGPGTYRLVFAGENTKQMRTTAFTLE